MTIDFARSSETEKSNKEGIIVGCTVHQEWLLPWWWMNFRLHNNYPVTFINFGDMSEKALEWCSKRGNVISLDLDDDFIVRKEKINPETAKKWQSLHSLIWTMRLAWFKKPFALLKTPYEKTIWMDLDCQTRGSLHPLFDEYLKFGDVAIVEECEKDHQLNRERGILLPYEIMYNTGVIAYTRDSVLIKEWAKQCVEQNHLFFGDQQLLARMLFNQHYSIVTLPLTYNWPAPYGVIPEAIILHWWGAYKQLIEKEIEFLKHNFFIDLTL